MTEATSKRVPGHNLCDEGAPYDDNGKRLGGFSLRTTGVGRSKCTCGALSEILPSAPKRKQWHREHKAKILLMLEDSWLP